MAKHNVTVENRKEMTVYGVSKRTSDRALARDIPELSEEYHRITGTESGKVLPFVVLSKNYDESTGEADLLVGGIIKSDRLESVFLPDGEYAVMTVRPKLGFFFGMAIGEAKRFFYTKWLPESGYLAKNLEYEYHTESSVGKKPSVDIIFAIARK